MSKQSGNAWERKKAYKAVRARREEGDAYSHSAGTVWLEIGSILLSAKNREALKRDWHQIDLMREQLERGVSLVPIVVWRRADGFYEIEDGRHRYLAHELAGRVLVECVLA